MPKKHFPEKKDKPAPKPRGRPRTHRTSAVGKNRIQDRAPSIGHEERLAVYKKRAFQLKFNGHYHHEIGEIIAREFELEAIVPPTTVSHWLKDSNDAVARDIQELQWQMRIEQFTQLERMKAKWLPLATAESLAITRWVRVEGELQPDLDENAVKEQIDATKAVVSIMNRQARLLGLDIEKSIAETGEGPGSLQELQVWLINQVNISTGAPNGKAIDIPADILELKAGLPEVDDNEV